MRVCARKSCTFVSSVVVSGTAVLIAKLPPRACQAAARPCKSSRRPRRETRLGSRGAAAGPRHLGGGGIVALTRPAASAGAPVDKRPTPRRSQPFGLPSRRAPSGTTEPREPPHGSYKVLGSPGRHGNPRRGRGGCLQPLNEIEPLEPDAVCLEQVEQQLRCFSVDGHEVIVCVVLEELRPGFEDVTVVLNQPFRAGIGLMNLALRAIARKEPVVAQGFCVLLLRDADALSRLLSEPLQLSRSNRQMSEDLENWHRPPSRSSIAENPARGVGPSPDPPALRVSSRIGMSGNAYDAPAGTFRRRGV